MYVVKLYLLPLSSLRGREEAWLAKLATLPSLETVTTNCVLAAAFTVYCPPLNTRHRHALFNAILEICEHCGLPAHDPHTLTPHTYPHFIIGEVLVTDKLYNLRNNYFCVCTGFTRSVSVRGTFPRYNQSTERVFPVVLS